MAVAKGARYALLALAAMAVGAGCAAPLPAAPTIFAERRVAVPGGLARLMDGACGVAAGSVVAQNRSGDHFRVTVRNGRVSLVSISCPADGRERPGDILPDGVVTRGGGDLAAAWLAEPTGRYDHGVLGDAIEAGALRALTAGGRELRHRLGADSVFEDRLARMVDLEGDGTTELLVVRSRLRRGASVAVFGLRGGRLVPLAESEPIGRSHRWLNPVGVADFDGDGVREIAAVVTPHLAGLLTFYRRRGPRLAVVHQSAGFSNHAAGSRELGLAAVADFNDDGVADIALPGLGRRTLRVVTLAGGRLTLLTEVVLGRQIVTAVIAADLDANGRPDLALGLKNGQLVVLTR